jgi:hypothetical protein
LLKFLPSRAGTPAGKIFFPNSPCPSPTPFFQRIYMALAHVEQFSPELVKMIPKTDEMQRRNSFTSVGSAQQSPESIRRQSYPPRFPITS